MSNIHIYAASMQPATNYIDRCTGEEMRFTNEPTELFYAHCCNKKRAAGRLLVQVYYDGCMFWCAPDCGCNHPIAVAKKRRREHMNRSRGQQARWEKQRPAA